MDAAVSSEDSPRNCRPYVARPYKARGGKSSRGARRPIWSEQGLDACPVCEAKTPANKSQAQGGCNECKAEYLRRARRRGPEPSLLKLMEAYRTEGPIRVKHLARSRLNNARRRGEEWAQLASECVDCHTTKDLTADHTQGYENENWRVFETRCRSCNRRRG